MCLEIDSFGENDLPVMSALDDTVRVVGQDSSSHSRHADPPVISWCYDEGYTCRSRK
jgi:hypothetical protein